MADLTYTTPIPVRGDMLASLTGQPTNNGNPGDPNFGIRLPNATALGSSTTEYRLVWFQNVNNTATQFGNGQFWRLQSYNPAADNDGDPTTGNNGWSTVPNFGNLTPKHDLVNNMGAGDEYIVFEGQNGRFLLYDLNGGLPTTPTNLTYYRNAVNRQLGENGDPALGDNDGELDFYDAYQAYICFVAGTLIDTPKGLVAVEDLRPGDLVWTLDHGAQSLRWVGRRDLSLCDLMVNPELRPVSVQAGALGDGLPQRALHLSPQHRLLVRSAIAQRMAGQDEVLVAVKHLVGLPGIAAMRAFRPVTYVHLMFDRHEVVLAEGAPAESLFTGPEALRAIGPEGRRELRLLFPELVRGDAAAPARVLLRGRVARRLAYRHGQNAKPLLRARG
ncbi:Hint domain-containing protein [Neogemmobacter tilapiae]|uniref:Hedgehog/Intein (Hint) domain-containing protein n=1 Tax=Neogemmobacter tilapiae TaxID=875041 RepID=A0A918TTC7_9RHOB|nr:Hint domain-containing protein [Gemmobacter tilapiae]GHC62679.1 hypothetical protein GCM10007315_28520 [Gemmobacter tilapiae]